MVVAPQKEQEWVLQSGGTEYGPYSIDELKMILRSGKLIGEKFVWKRGLLNWLCVNDQDDLTKQLPLAIEQAAAVLIERGHECSEIYPLHLNCHCRDFDWKWEVPWHLFRSFTNGFAGDPPSGDP